MGQVVIGFVVKEVVVTGMKLVCVVAYPESLRSIYVFVYFGVIYILGIGSNWFVVWGVVVGGMVVMVIVVVVGVGAYPDSFR